MQLTETGQAGRAGYPISPVKGQIVITEQVPLLIQHQIMDSKFIVAKHRPDLLKSKMSSDLHVGLSISQSRTGNLIIGGCRENAGFDTHTTFQAIKEIAQNAASYFPVLKDISIIRTFAGLRPSSQDNRPILGKTPVDGYLLASGLGGDGLSLSPLVGSIIGDLATKGYSGRVDMKELSLDRFLKEK